MRAPGHVRVSSAGRIAARLPIYLADVRARPAWFLMFSLARITLLRRIYGRIWRRLKRDNQLRDFASLSEPLSAMTPAIIADQIRSDGFCKGLQLACDDVNAMRRFATNTPCYAGGDRRFPLLASTHAAAEERYGRAIVAGHLLDQVMTCDAAVRIIESTWLRAVAQEYLGASPSLVAARMWWSFNSSRARQRDFSMASQNGFHFDLDDWQQIKFFFYLTDVDAATGAHVYVAGSHRRHAIRQQFSPFVGCSERFIRRRYGKNALVTILGAAGSGFAEDPYGYHTGTSIIAGERLILEVSYGTTDAMPARRHGETTPA